MTKKQRFKNVMNWFEHNTESAETELHYANNYQLLIAVILSAQCTDKRVNLITPPFFRQFPDAAHLAAASRDDIFSLISSCSAGWSVC
mgnify:CR=1 FL=1